LRTTTQDSRIAQTVAQDMRTIIDDDLDHSSERWCHIAARLGGNLQEIGAAMTAASAGADRERPVRLIGWIADSLAETERN